MHQSHFHLHAQWITNNKWSSVGMTLIDMDNRHLSVSRLQRKPRHMNKCKKFPLTCYLGKIKIISSFILIFSSIKSTFMTFERQWVLANLTIMFSLNQVSLTMHFSVYHVAPAIWRTPSTYIFSNMLRSASVEKIDKANSV